MVFFIAADERQEFVTSGHRVYSSLGKTTTIRNTTAPNIVPRNANNQDTLPWVYGQAPLQEEVTAKVVHTPPQC